MAFEFAWLPMVMFGGRLGSVLSLDLEDFGPTWKFESRKLRCWLVRLRFPSTLALIYCRSEKVRKSFIPPSREHQPLQPEGLDFKPFWCPVFWVFLPDVQALWHGQVGRIHVEHKPSYIFRTNTCQDFRLSRLSQSILCFVDICMVAGVKLARMSFQMTFGQSWLRDLLRNLADGS